MLFGSSTLPSASTRAAWMESVGPSSLDQTTTWYMPPKALSEGRTLAVEIEKPFGSRTVPSGRTRVPRRPGAPPQATR